MPNLNHVGSPALIQWQGQNSPDQAEPIPFLLTDKIFEGSKLLRYFMDRKLLFGGRKYVLYPCVGNEKNQSCMGH